jgi:hypothetical protein
MAFLDGKMYYVEQKPYKDWIDGSTNKELSIVRPKFEIYSFLTWSIPRIEIDLNVTTIRQQQIGL